MKRNISHLLSASAWIIQEFSSDFSLFEIGPALVRGLAEIVERRPNDPIEYLATFLYKQVDNSRAQKQVEHHSIESYVDVVVVVVI